MLIILKFNKNISQTAQTLGSPLLHADNIDAKNVLKGAFPL